MTGHGVTTDSVERALACHAEQGRIRGWRRTAVGRGAALRTGWVLDLNGGADLTLRTLREAALACAVLASAHRAAGPFGPAGEAAVLRQAAEVVRRYRGGLGTTLAVLEETAVHLEQSSANRSGRND